MWQNVTLSNLVLQKWFLISQKFGFHENRRHISPLYIPRTQKADNLLQAYWQTNKIDPGAERLTARSRRWKYQTSKEQKHSTILSSTTHPPKNVQCKGDIASAAEASSSCPVKIHKREPFLGSRDAKQGGGQRNAGSPKIQEEHIVTAHAVRHTDVCVCSSLTLT